MNRYRYEYAAGVKGRGRYLVLDVKRGTPDKYISDPAERAVAQCRSADDAQMIAGALNAAERRREADEERRAERHAELCAYSRVLAHFGG